MVNGTTHFIRKNCLSNYVTHPKMNQPSQKALKIAHLFFVCLWVSGVCTLALLKQGSHPDN
jgi:hypothetical protein